MSPAGLEETANSREKSKASEERAAESGAISTEFVLAYPDLAVVETAWPTLPEATRRAIIKLIKEPATD